MFTTHVPYRSKVVHSGDLEYSFVPMLKTQKGVSKYNLCHVSPIKLCNFTKSSNVSSSGLDCTKNSWVFKAKDGE